MAKVLLVDDEPSAVFMAKIRFEANGHEFVSAGDGAEAFKKAREEKPDVIIMDIMLPDTDGFSLCRKIKSEESCKDIPIIMLSGRTDDEDREAGKEAGASAYVTKPFNAQEVLGKIKEVLGE